MGNPVEYHIIRRCGRTIAFYTSTLRISPVSDPDHIRDRDMGAEKSHPDAPPEQYLFDSLCLILTDACNLRCIYCFEHIISPEKQPRTISPSLAREAIDFFLAHSTRQDLTILLFGGEPMLWWEHMPDLIRYGNSCAEKCNKSIQWNISTNGTHIPEGAAGFLKDHRVCLMIDLDGTEDEHNRHRPFVSGEGSHAAVLAGYQRLISAGVSPVMLRATITPGNPDAFQYYRTLMNLQPDSVLVFPLFFAEGTDSPSWDPETTTNLLEGYTRIAEYILGQILEDREQKIYDFPFSDFLHHLVAQEKKSGYCGGYGRMIMVSPDGSFSPCPILDRQMEYTIGDINGGVCLESLQRWKTLCTIENRPACRECWARNLCGGGCISHAVLTNGTDGTPTPFECDLIRHIAELSIWLYVEILEKKPGYFIRYVPEYWAELQHRFLNHSRDH